METRHIYVSESGYEGIVMRYVLTDTGRYLYEQKRHLMPGTWRKMLINGLRRAGFTESDISRICAEVCNGNYYFNRRFYRPVRFIVQERIELGG